MNNMIKNIIGLGGMTEKVVASDYLISTRTNVRNLAFAITETMDHDLKAALRDELRNAVKAHEDISNYMIATGMYHPHNLEEQLKVDMQITNTALSLTQNS